jgi:diguanylate cyclase (GGDEF)-like protein
MRTVAILAVVIVAAAGVVVAVLPIPAPAWAGTVEHLVLVAAAGAVVGASIATIVLTVLMGVRLWRMVQATERIAAGDYTIAIHAHGRGLDRRLARAVNRIAESMADTHDRATIDRLTGVFNRQAILAELFSEVERASRYDRPLCVAFVDIDHFKVVNDSYGHESGDRVLRGVAQILATNVRASDLVGRYGGEEFMLVLAETNVEEGAALAEKLRSLVEGETFSVLGNPALTVTISVGIVGGFGQQLRMEALVRDADAAMYSAKSLGRNQTYIFAEPDEDARVPRAPISAAGRARAVELGRMAREAAVDVLARVTAPLPSHRGRPSALIASIVTTMSRSLQLPEAEVERIRIAALLCDVGKVAIPSEILEKPTALTTAEWRTVVQHPRIGQVILEQAAALKDAIPIILHHHERFAGHGYPFGLRAAEIPLGARIVAIADAYDAMTHDRPYKAAISHEAAIAELQRHAGTQFDPELVTLFCELFAAAAPVPDPAVLAMTATAGGEERRRSATGGSAAERKTVDARAAERTTADARASKQPLGTLGPGSGVTVELETERRVTQPAADGTGRVAG